MRRWRARRDVSDPTTYYGYRAHTRARSTGTTVVLLDGHDADISTPGDGDGRWCLLCDEHSGITTFQRQSEARRYLAHPEEWCPGCQSTIDS